MYTKQEIIIGSYREGKSQRQISRDLQISRKTIRKYLCEHEEALQSAESVQIARSGNLSSEPCYKMTTPRTKIKLTREVEAAIDELLEKNEQKKQQGLGKQMLKKKDIHEVLQGQGHEISYTTVCNYIMQKENRQGRKPIFVKYTGREKLASLTGVRSNSRYREKGDRSGLPYLPLHIIITGMPSSTNGRIRLLLWNPMCGFFKSSEEFTINP